MSGRKNVLLPVKDPLISAQSMASSFNGTAFYIQYEDNVGVQLYWTGANPVGSITFQVSMDFNLKAGTGTWTTIQTSPGNNLTVSPGGAAGDSYIDFNQLSAPWIRVVYTTAGGSVGNLTATISAKMI